jgi:hypothetical protein
MSKYECRCGHVMHLSTGQEPYDLRLIPNRSVEEMGDKFYEGVPLTSDEFYERIEADALTVYRCPKCDRIHISTPSLNSNKFRVYEPSEWVGS